MELKATKKEEAVESVCSKRDFSAWILGFSFLLGLGLSPFMVWLLHMSDWSWPLSSGLGVHTFKTKPNNVRAVAMLEMTCASSKYDNIPGAVRIRWKSQPRKLVQVVVVETNSHRHLYLQPENVPVNLKRRKLFCSYQNKSEWISLRV